MMCALGLVAALALGCNKPAPTQSEIRPKVQPVALGPDEPYKTLPSDIFKDMPIYPGATIEHVRRPKGAMREILFSAGDATMPELVDYFKTHLQKNGFSITSSLVMPSRRTWSCDFHKGGRLGNIMLYPSDKDKSKMIIDLFYALPSKVDEAMLAPIENFDVIGPGPPVVHASVSNQTTKQN